MMNKRLTLLREKMKEKDLDGLLITSPFNRRYVSGFTGSAGYLLITMEQALLLTDFRYIDQATEQAAFFSVIQHPSSILEEVGKQITALQLKKIGFEKQHVTFALYEGLKRSAQHADWIGIEAIIEEMRMVKTKEELQTIKAACSIADQTFEHILNYIKDGVKERDIALELEYYMRKLGASSSSFDIIVASGIRSALPHGVASDKVIRSGEFVTLDFGAYYEGYVSDITRTVAVGEPTKQLKEIYQIVLDAQVYGVTHLKPGMSGKQADALTRDLIEQSGYGDNFGHSTGHGIGLEVHEGPGLSSKSDLILRQGMVVTVEPGIYVSQLGGVRIEDDVVITENGCEILTKSPKEIIIL
jgi:Xaa-Pro aminopeptidase